jgi:putative flippase GtrA
MSMPEYATCRQKVRNALLGKTENLFLQLFRYTLVGGLAFVVDFGSLYVLKSSCGFHYLAAGALAFVLGLTVNYFISIQWVFNSRAVGNRLMEFVIFAGIGLVGLVLNELLLWVFTGLLAIYYLKSKLITAFIVYFWNFFARKLILFNTKKS